MQVFAYVHERLTLSIAASLGTGPPRKTARGKRKHGAYRLMSMKPCYISQCYSAEGCIWRLAQHTWCRCLRETYNTGRLSKHLARCNTPHLHLNGFTCGFYRIVFQVCYTTCWLDSRSRNDRCAQLQLHGALTRHREEPELFHYSEFTI